MSSPPPADKKAIATATGLYKKLHSFDFIASLMLMKNVMLKTKRLSEELQNDELNIVDALSLTKSTVQSLQRMQEKDEEIDAQIRAACQFAEKLEIDPERDYQKLHRVRRPPRRVDDHPETTASISLHQFYRKEYKCVIDTLVVQFKDKMQPTLDVIAPFDRVLGIPFKLSAIEDVERLAEMCTDDLNVDVLAAELELFKGIIDESTEILGNVSDAAQLAHRHRRILPLTWKSYQLLLTAPITVAKDERTFSHLKFIKNVYRSTMGDNRLDELMLLNCEKDLTDSVDLEDVLKKWALKPRR